MAIEQRVAEHYTRSDLASTILGALRAAGKDVDRLSLEDLAPVDEFHVRGRPATVELAGRARARSRHARPRRRQRHRRPLALRRRDLRLSRSWAST